jgi:CheY-like chemotaxis protein
MRATIRILIVEDEVISAMILQKQLNNLGYLVLDHVTTGERAIASIAQNPPDMILMDISLPGEFDGIETAERIKTKVDLPIIFISGYADKVISDRAQKTNPIAYLTKPYDLFTLKNILDTHFNEGSEYNAP